MWVDFFYKYLSQKIFRGNELGWAFCFAFYSKAEVFRFDLEATLGAVIAFILMLIMVVEVGGIFSFETHCSSDSRAVKLGTIPVVFLIFCRHGEKFANFNLVILSYLVFLFA